MNVCIHKYNYSKKCMYSDLLSLVQIIRKYSNKCMYTQTIVCRRVISNFNHL